MIFSQMLFQRYLQMDGVRREMTTTGSGEGVAKRASFNSTGSLALIDNVRERPVFLGQLADAAIVVVKAADGMEDEPGAEHD